MSPRLLHAKVVHRRLEPASPGFTYGVLYWAIPLSRLSGLACGALAQVNRAALTSLRERDHGPRDGSALEPWARRTAAAWGIAEVDEIVLVAIPRVLGYAFNPVSFYLCLDRARALRGVLVDVNNTFGENHLYVCAHPGGRPIVRGDVIRAEKLFHVSPFLDRSGGYEFSFALEDASIAIAIVHTAPAGGRLLATSLAGPLQPFSRRNLALALLRYPLVTAKVTFAIHWQALRLWLRGLRLYKNPQQIVPNVSGSIAVPEGGKQDAGSLEP